MATFRVGERILITATGESGVVTVVHAGSEPRKYTMRVDPPSWSGGAIHTRPLHRIYTEANLERADD